MQELLAFKQCAVLDDFLGTAAHACERSHNDGHKEVADEVLVVHDGISLGWSIACEEGTDHCQQGSLQESDAEILHVGNLRLEVTVQEDGELFQYARFLLVGRWYVADSGGGQLRTVLQIELVPLLGRHLTLVRHLAIAIERLLINDVEYDFGIDVAAHGASAGLCIGIVCGLLEIGDSVDGVAVEHGISATIEQPETVEEFIDVAGRLVDVDDDELPLQRLFLQ